MLVVVAGEQMAPQSPQSAAAIRSSMAALVTWSVATQYLLDLLRCCLSGEGPAARPARDLDDRALRRLAWPGQGGSLQAVSERCVIATGKVVPDASGRCPHPAG